MAQRHRKLPVKKVFITLLALILVAGYCPLSTEAAKKASWTEEKIIGAFSPTDPNYYNSTQFLIKSKDMAYLLAGNLGEDDWGYNLIYDDQESTATEQKYLLMRNDQSGVNGSYMTIWLNMTVNKKDEVLGLALSLTPETWPEDQLVTVMKAMADIYCLLHGNMTEETRHQLVTKQNLAEDSGQYKANGIFDDLYYEFKVSETSVSMIIRPAAGATLLPATMNYAPKDLYGADAFNVRAGNLAVTPLGEIILDLELTNKSANPLRFESQFARIGNYDIALPVFTEVAPGNTKTEQIRIHPTMLRAVGVDEVYALGLFFCVTDLKTEETLFDYGDYISWGMYRLQADDTLFKSSTKLFQNSALTLSLAGSRRNPQNGRPQIYLVLDNNIYGYVRISSEGNCISGKQEYDLYVSGFTTEYSKGIISVQPMIHSLDKTTTLEFNLEISSYNYNDMVSGPVTIKLDQNGKILSVSSKMKETANFEDILKNEY